MRFTSGIVFSSISLWYAQAVKSLKHLPAATLPALPALWFDEACKYDIVSGCVIQHQHYHPPLSRARPQVTPCQYEGCSSAVSQIQDQ